MTHPPKDPNEWPVLPKPPLVNPLDAWLLDEPDDVEELPDPRLGHDDPLLPPPLRPEEQFCDVFVPTCADGSALQVLDGEAV
jgi:hypothetical protein